MATPLETREESEQIEFKEEDFDITWDEFQAQLEAGTATNPRLLQLHEKTEKTIQKLVNHILRKSGKL